MNKLILICLFSASVFVSGCATSGIGTSGKYLKYAGPQVDPPVVVTGTITGGSEPRVVGTGTSGFGPTGSNVAIPSTKINNGVDQALLITHQGQPGTCFVRGIVRQAGGKQPVVLYAILVPSRRLVLVARYKQQRVQGMAVLGRPDDDYASVMHDLKMRKLNGVNIYSEEFLQNIDNHLKMPSTFGFQVFYDFSLYRITSDDLLNAINQAVVSRPYCVDVYQSQQDRAGLKYPECHWLETSQQILAEAFMYGDGLTRDDEFLKPTVFSALRHFRNGYSGLTQETLAKIIDQLDSEETLQLRKDETTPVDLNSIVEMKEASDTSLGDFKQGKLSDVIKEIDKRILVSWLAKGKETAFFRRYKAVDCFMRNNMGIHFLDSWSIKNQAATSLLRTEITNDFYIKDGMENGLKRGNLRRPAMVSEWSVCQPPELVGVPRVDYYVQGIPPFKGVPTDGCLQIKTALKIRGVPVSSETRIKKICVGD